MPWSEFLEELQGRYPSTLAFAFAWWHYNVPLFEKIRRAREEGSGAVSPEIAASLAVFLASSEADYITGQDVIIDGGMLATHPGHVQG